MQYRKLPHGRGQISVIRHLGVSSHTPEIVRRFLDTGLLYRECEKAGVGIAVMKFFSGGQLLDARTSPFRQALTENQCIQYALDRPVQKG